MFAAAVSAEKIIPVLEVKGADTKARNYMGVNHQEIIQWRRHGLENMKGVVKPKPKFSLPTISVKTVNEVSQETPPAAVVTTKPIVSSVEKMASPIPPETNKKMDDNMEAAGETVTLPEPKIFIKQEVIARSSNVDNQEIHFNDENDQNQMNQMMTNPNLLVQAKARKDKRVVQPSLRNDSPIIQHAFNFQSPYNGLPCPLYFPVLNSPYGAPVPSPVTPMMIHSPFPNMMAAIGDMPQNTPLNVNGQNPFQFPPGPPVFFPGPVPRPDMNYAYDSTTATPNPGGYPGSPFFYTVYPPMPNVYPVPGPGPNP